MGQARLPVLLLAVLWALLMLAAGGAELASDDPEPEPVVVRGGQGSCSHGSERRPQQGADLRCAAHDEMPERRVIGDTPASQEADEGPRAQLVAATQRPERSSTTASSSDADACDPKTVDGEGRPVRDADGCCEQRADGSWRTADGEACRCTVGADGETSCQHAASASTAGPKGQPKPQPKQGSEPEPLAQPDPGDVCSNLPGHQSSTPSGQERSGTTCTPLSDVCPNLAGAQQTLPENTIERDGRCYRQRTMRLIDAKLPLIAPKGGAATVELGEVDVDESGGKILASGQRAASGSRWFPWLETWELVALIAGPLLLAAVCVWLALHQRRLALTERRRALAELEAVRDQPPAPTASDAPPPASGDPPAPGQPS